MENLLTQSNVMFVLGLSAVVFGIYRYFKDPQVDSEKKDALLAQQIQWTIEGNERRFLEVQNSVREAFGLAQNHTHSVEVKVDNLTNIVGDINKEIVKLSTIIEERIPKK